MTSELQLDDVVERAAADDIEAPRAAWRPLWQRPSWPGIRHCLLVFLYVRVGLLVVGALSTALLPANKGVDVPGWPARPVTPGWHNLFTSWERFDALWYLRIASTGFRNDDASAAFFPLYPMLTRVVAVPLGHHWLLGAYLVSNGALIVALVLLYRLSELEFGELVARRSVVYLCVFPTGFFLFAPYTESLFLALALGCLYAARRSRWLVAGVLGLLASATRSPGIALAVPIVVEAALQIRSNPAGRLRRGLTALAGAALVPLGTVAYLAYWGRYGGDWHRPLDLQRTNWAKEYSTPWHTLRAGYHLGLQFIGSYPGGYHTLDLLIVVVVLVAAVWVVVRVRPTYSVYLLLSLLPPLLLTYDGRPLISFPRYYLIGFPCFWAFARLAERWRAHDLIVAGSAALLGVMSILYVNWYFVF